jgi:predicted AAA+ superfamily ATPase
VGKTTLAQRLANELDPHPAYLNWDSAEDRRLIRALRFPSDARVLVLDEIHKFSGWRNHIKGLFDKHKDRYQILVTGSSRLDYYRRGGDSLLGRYHHYRLHPFSVAEILTETRAQSAKIHTPFKELEFPPSNPRPLPRWND